MAVKGGARVGTPERPLRILMMIHRQADHSPYCFYVHEQAKALRGRGHDVTVISCVGVMPMMRRLRPAQADVARRTPARADVDGIPVYYPRCLTMGNAGERVLGGVPMALAALPQAMRLDREKRFDIVHAHMLPRDGHAGLLVAKALRVPLALTVHGTDVLQYFLPGRVPWPRNVRIAREADALMAVSSLLLGRVAPYRGGGKITRVVQNGVDLSLIPEQHANRPRAVLSVGTLKPRKCMDRTLGSVCQADRRVSRRHADSRGDGRNAGAALRPRPRTGAGEPRDAYRRNGARRGAQAHGAERPVCAAQLGRRIRHCVHRGHGGRLHRRGRAERGH